MQFGIKIVACAGFALALGSCALGRGDIDRSLANPMPVSSGVQDMPVKIDAPYKVGNVNYTPDDTANYDDVGYASWYGPERQGQPTANGEIFVPAAVTAAHKTLPMPSYAEVTALDTGRTILVRINDRGPFANDRLIDLSDGAAQQLGIAGQGVAGVRVRRVNPPEQERAALRSGVAATTRLDTPESLLKVLREKLSKLQRPSLRSNPPPIAADVLRAADAQKSAAPAGGRFVKERRGQPVSPASVPPRPMSSEGSSSGYVVQIGAFASQARADALANKGGANVSASGDRRLFRVRYGPFATEAEAQAALANARKRGYPQAKLVRE